MSCWLPPWILMVKTPDVVLIGLRFGSPFSGEVPESSWPTVWTEGAFFFRQAVDVIYIYIYILSGDVRILRKLWQKMGSYGIHRTPRLLIMSKYSSGLTIQYNGTFPKTLEVWCPIWYIGYIYIYMYVMYPNLNWFHGCYQSSGNIRTRSNNQWVGGDLSTLFNSELPSPETQELLP